MSSDSDRPRAENQEDEQDGTYRIVDDGRKDGSGDSPKGKKPSLTDLVALDDEPVADEASSADEGDSAEREDGDGAADGEADDALPTLHDVEPLLAKGNYQGICDLLGPLERAEQLDPASALLYATAHKEVGSADSEEDVNPLAIRSVASLLEVSATSRTALMVAKRVLRKNPVIWQKRKAPGAPARVFMIIFGLAIGIIGGWLAGPGTVQLQEVIQTMMR
ncbi:MAG: hypothetical protein JRI68_00275 [Deltaproteobacteria bacterium]|nr:hypothetical protein [Deltaproteobacteria bacterium]